MPTVTRKVKGSEYLYYRQWDSNSKEHHDEYLGRKGKKETELRAHQREREAIIKQMDTLQLKLTEIDATLKNFQPDEKIECHPFVKWAGGKTQLINRMKEYFPEKFNRYWEPFLGGGSVFFHLVSTRHAFPATLSDANRDLINAYEVIRDDVEGLMKSLKKSQFEFQSNTTKASKNDYYLKVRESPPDIDTSQTERAGWFIFLNKTAIMGYIV